MKSMRLVAVAAAVAMAALGMAGCTWQTNAAKAGPVSLTFWTDGACPSDGSCYYDVLAKAFEKQNPSVTIKIVTRPADSYFLDLKSASISGQGPDLATVWPGSYLTPLKRYLADARKWVPAAELKDSAGIVNYAEGGSVRNAVFAVPAAGQWYTGYYNKALLAANGISSPPSTWDELESASQKLKAAGVLPIAEGMAGESGAHFQVAFEWSYLLAALPLKDWNKLLNGTMKYDNPVIADQVGRWQRLYAQGFVNQDAYNSQTSFEEFKAGKVGMVLGSGSWKAAELSKALGDKLGVLPDPFSSKTQRAIVQTPGEAVAATKYGKNADTAGKFLAFILSNKGQQAIASTGSPGTRPGSAPPASVAGGAEAAELLHITNQPGARVYPMFDNLMQTTVWDVVSSQMPQVFVGQGSAAGALKAIDAAVAALPADQKKVNYGLGG